MITNWLKGLLVGTLPKNKPFQPRVFFAQSQGQTASLWNADPRQLTKREYKVRCKHMMHKLRKEGQIPERGEWPPFQIRHIFYRNGKRVSAKWFSPSTYLSTPRRAEEGLKPGTMVLHMEIYQEAAISDKA